MNRDIQNFMGIFRNNSAENNQIKNESKNLLSHIITDQNNHFSTNIHNNQNHFINHHNDNSMNYSSYSQHKRRRTNFFETANSHLQFFVKRFEKEKIRSIKFDVKLHKGRGSQDKSNFAFGPRLEFCFSSKPKSRVLPFVRNFKLLNYSEESPLSNIIFKNLIGEKRKANPAIHYTEKKIKFMNKYTERNKNFENPFQNNEDSLLRISEECNFDENNEEIGCII